jgi:aminoglycoside phosphotransferase (APT) family kinase protein
LADSLQELKQRIEAHLREQTGSIATLTELSRLPGGACQDNFRLEVSLESPAVAGHRRMVLRSDARSSLPGSLGRREEFAVVRAAREAGTPTPQAHWLGKDIVRPGAFAYFLDWVDGEVIGRRVVRNPELAEARSRLPGQLARALASIHSVTPENAPFLSFPNRPLGASPAQSALHWLRKQQDEMPEAHPALELAFHWLRENAPKTEERTLVHGDFRTGNFMVRPDGLAGVLDWEFSHWGDPMEDLAWICVRDWRFGQLNRPVGGIGQRDPFYQAYELASGRKVNPKLVHYWEVVGNVRWASGSIYQGERYLSGEESDIELVAIARRASEMEFEALRLIERGP